MIAECYKREDGKYCARVSKSKNLKSFKELDDGGFSYEMHDEVVVGPFDTIDETSKYVFENYPYTKMMIEPEE